MDAPLLFAGTCVPPGLGGAPLPLLSPPLGFTLPVGPLPAAGKHLVSSASAAYLPV